MAEYQEQSNPVADPECSFSAHCGRNVIVDGQTARWNSVVSGGRVVVDKPIPPGEERKLSFVGKGHAEVGILTKDPASLPDINNVENLKELTVIQSARIYKQTGTANIRRSDCGRKIITEADKESSVTVRRDDNVWVTVNIIFGDLEIEIETEGYSFSKKHGGNIQLEHYDTWANLLFPNPCAVCFVEQPIRRKETLNFQIEPILREGKPSRNFSIKIAISHSNPMDIMSGNDMYYDITSLPVIHFDEFPNKCKNEIQIKLSDNGTVQINHEKGTLAKETNNEQIYCIFELCRIKLHCKSKTKQANRDEAQSSAEDVNTPDAIVVPPNSEYVRSKKLLESIRHEAEFISIQPMESRIIDVSPLIVKNDSNINNPTVSRIGSNETLPSGEHISLSHNREDINSRLQSVEETIGNRETGKEVMRQSQYQELKSEIQAIKTMLSKMQSTGPSPTELDKCYPEESLTEVLQNNYVNLVNNLEAVPLLDLLFELDYISLNESHRLGVLSEKDRASANRELLGILMRRKSVDLKKLESVLFQSKQIGILAVLFPYKYGKQKQSQRTASYYKESLP